MDDTCGKTCVLCHYIRCRNIREAVLQKGSRDCDTERTFPVIAWDTLFGKAVGNFKGDGYIIAVLRVSVNDPLMSQGRSADLNSVLWSGRSFSGLKLWIKQGSYIAPNVPVNRKVRAKGINYEVINGCWGGGGLNNVDPFLNAFGDDLILLPSVFIHVYFVLNLKNIKLNLTNIVFRRLDLLSLAGKERDNCSVRSGRASYS